MMATNDLVAAAAEAAGVNRLDDDCGDTKSPLAAATDGSSPSAISIDEGDQGYDEMSPTVWNESPAESVRKAMTLGDDFQDLLLDQSHTIAEQRMPHDVETTNRHRTTSTDRRLDRHRRTSSSPSTDMQQPRRPCQPSPDCYPGSRRADSVSPACRIRRPLPGI